MVPERPGATVPSPATPADIAAELTLAVHDLNARGLFQAAQWAAEQLVGLELHSPHQGASGWQHHQQHHPQGHAGFTSRTSSPQTANLLSRNDPDEQHPQYLLARAYFQSKEYRRTAHALSGLTGPLPTFLRLYATYLAGEKRRDPTAVAASATPLLFPAASAPVVQTNAPPSPTAVAAAATLMLFPAAAAPVVQTNAPPSPTAVAAAATPLLFPAASAPVVQTNAPPSPTAIAAAATPLLIPAAAAPVVQTNAPPSPTTVAAAATLLLFPAAAGTDTFSNILFVKEAAAPLSVLAHRVAATDKYRPETCCVLGNYYSLQAASQAGPYREVGCLPAKVWCVGRDGRDAYRRAIDVSPQDFRAWYGLGQAYELLKMPYYALYYYRRAAQLRPTDARMWCALAQCFVHEQIGLQDAAVRAYQRAIAHDDPDGIAVHKLAKLYESRGEPHAAERLFRDSLRRLERHSHAFLSLSFAAHNFPTSLPRMCLCPLLLLPGQFDRSTAVAALHRTGGDPVAAVRAYWYPVTGGGGGEGPEHGA
ncbi:hypothetical protein VOLCADRAFT_100315 [Volvox carteri f. nagariensis]|uniref:Cdc23 domain-containing protein n=1 Tax=Volvox carteri f. nagariensis TaxID=3068 RepID=D8UJZ4_VOLCA|nr:uncharacterized protein VOLCADRAFT_100315 [Volvox carteri f. nagariensis]EFJ39960.1 hypothetical protein VOLCADRAFT_100315 [Volvox carteri f. nagariensis]|eukprot:XP_002958985.1 hypothetical protein VOLCADRAFT_100315 [Volvox carteri f. nagariensis]